MMNIALRKATTFRWPGGASSRWISFRFQLTHSRTECPLCKDVLWFPVSSVSFLEWYTILDLRTRPENSVKGTYKPNMYSWWAVECRCTLAVSKKQINCFQPTPNWIRYEAPLRAPAPQHRVNTLMGTFPHSGMKNILISICTLWQCGLVALALQVSISKHHVRRVTTSST